LYIISKLFKDFKNITNIKNHKYYKCNIRWKSRKKLYI